MEAGNITGGGGGDEDLAENWFDIISKKHMNELGLLIKCCSKVLFPPARGHGVQRVTGKILCALLSKLVKSAEKFINLILNYSVQCNIEA